MTDNNKHTTMQMTKGCEPLVSMDDEKLLESFFADCRMDIPDDGFSDRVMAALPAVEFGKAMDTESEKLPVVSRRLEHLWTAACVAVGLIAAVVCQGWEQIQGLFYAMRIDFLLSASHALSHTAEVIGQAHNLWMMLLGALVLVFVWGYNEVADAR